MTLEELKHYWVRELKWGDGHSSRLEFDFLLAAANFCRQGVVLDAGAGHKRYAPFFSDAIYLSQEHPDGIQFKNMQAIQYDFIAPIDQRIPLKGNVIDAVLSTSVIEHIRYPDAFLAEAFRVLRPGGRIYVSVLFVYPEHEKPYDFQRPTQFGLKRWLEDVGFANIEVKPSSSSSYTVVNFLMEAINEDYRHGGLLHSALKRLVRLLVWLVDRYVDKGPLPTTAFPCGWIAVAEKPLAPFEPVVVKDKEDFIKRYALGA